MYNKYLNSPVIRTVNYVVRKEFPGIVTDFHEDYNGTGVMSFKVGNELRKEYKLAETYKEFPILNNRLTGAVSLNPFSYDALTRLIEDTEISMEVNKARSYSENTRRALYEAQKFASEAYVGICDRDDKIFISFKLGTTERYYMKNKGEKKSHLIKCENAESYNQIRFSDLEPGLRYDIIHTAFPGLNVKAAEYIAGIREDKIYWPDVEEAYAKEYHRKLYNMLKLRPLDIVYDTYDSIRVGDFADSPMRRLILADGRDFAYRIEKDSLGEDKIRIVEYKDYLSIRSNIINEYKRDIMYVYKMTGTVPAVAIKLMNTVSPDVGYKLIDKETAISRIRKKRLEDPLDYVENYINKMIESDNMQWDITVSIRNEKAEDLVRKIVISTAGKTLRADIDLKTLSVSSLQSGGITGTKEFIPKEGDYLLKIYNQIINEVRKLADTDEYKCFMFIKGLENKGIRHLSSGEAENIEYMINLNQCNLIFSPYLKTLSMTKSAEPDPDDIKCIEYIKKLYQQIYTTK